MVSKTALQKFKDEFVQLMVVTEGNFILCCSEKGVTPDEIQDIRDDDRDFDRKLEIEINRRNASVAQKLHELAMQGDQQALKTLTSTTGFKDYLGIVVVKPKQRSNRQTLSDEDKEWVESVSGDLVE